jgi:histidyl-tRNA synthetase
MCPAPKVSAVRGFRDVLPDESHVWRRVEQCAEEIFTDYGFAPVSLPVLERVDLFARSLGDTSDVVEKEMFAFEDRDGTTVALRPEATASTVRAYLEGGPGAQAGRARYWYAGPMFRRERPQRGRYRQFQQIGAEIFGEAGPMADAELVLMLADYLAAIGVRDTRLLLGTVGDGRCRPAYRDVLRAYAAARREALCANCRQRLERNPLRLLDCKEEACRAEMAGAPLLSDHLCGECAEHFVAVRRLLDGEGVAYEFTPRLVRGLDYYSRTAFEVLASGLGAQNAVGGGGRYDGLVEALGGPSVPALGFALGVDRLAMVLEAPEGVSSEGTAVLPLNEAAAGPALSLATRLRRGGHRVLLEPPGRSVKAMLRAADRQGARLAVLLGDDELAGGTLTIRDLRQRRDHPGVLPVDVTATRFAEWMRAQNEGGA